MFRPYRARFSECRLAGLVAGLLLVLTLPNFAQKTHPFVPVTRGAYLQSGTPTSVVVRWRTAQRMTSVVRYGRRPGNLDQVASSPGRLKDHVVLVAGLNPGTEYFYSIGTSNQVLQAGALNSFITAPPPGSTQPIRVWVLGDPGTGSPVQKAVRDAYQRLAGARSADLILTLGDNAYGSGTDRQYQGRFFDVYRSMLKHTVLWPCLGNHDARSADSATESGVYYSIFTLPRMGQAGGVPSGTAAYYSFDYGNAHFICLNSHDSDRSIGGPMLSWLRRDLEANRQEWTIAYWHHAPYSKGSHDSDTTEGEDLRMTQMREQAGPYLERAGVDLVLCGHSHVYERSFLLHGHYGQSDSFRPSMILDRGDGSITGSGPYQKIASGSTPAFGTIYVNAGSAGHSSKPKDLHGLDHPAMVRSLNVPGSLVIQIAGSRLDAFFLTDTGQQPDRFTILKTR